MHGLDRRPERAPHPTLIFRCRPGRLPGNRKIHIRIISGRERPKLMFSNCIFGCKRQGACAVSTAEAELTSMNYALRHCGLPSLIVWQILLPAFQALYCHEDNQAMIRICQTGHNPTMRYLQHTQRISVAWLHERFSGGDLSLCYETSDQMAADIFTHISQMPNSGYTNANL